MSLTAETLTFRYPGRETVLENVSLTVSPGERVGLSGPSGRGKTTLCKLLAGYERPVQGRVLADGEPLASFSGPCPVQLIWQHPESAVDPLLPLAESLAEGGAPEARIVDALHIQPAWGKRYPAELSAGELQRFCIARALKPGVRYLLCDEITAMLDPITQAQIWRFLLEEAQRRPLGLLIVSHDAALLDALCTRAVSLDPPPAG